MDDIVERLERFCDFRDAKLVEELNDEAAAKITRLRAELAALREPAGDALVEVAARRLAAVKMGLVNDPNGEGLPDVLWRQAVPQARAVLDAVLPRVRAEGWRTMESAPEDDLVLTYGDSGACVAYLSHGKWRQPYKTYHDDVDPDGVSHWRPLPPPPDAAP